jgi:plastocyanin
VRLPKRLLTSGASIALAVSSLIPMAHSAGAAANTYVIKVDNASPTGHNYQYNDFFPRSGTSILSGDIVDFRWDTGSKDGFHTATVLKSGETPAQAWQASPIMVADPDDVAGTFQENPAVDGPSSPPAGSGAPGACGDAATPCAYDGSKDVNSGAHPTGPGNDFFVTITGAAGTTVNFVCLVHPGMAASLSIVGSSPSPTDLSAAVASQKAADDAEATAAAAAVTPAAPTTASNGSKTYTVVLGAESQHMQVLEMLPPKVNIKAGDSVKYTSAVHEPHTVAFPIGSAPETDFTAFMCEGSGTTDTPTAPPPSCAGGPTNFEAHLLLKPVGGSVIASTATKAASGVLFGPGGPPVPSSFTFSFPNAGTFSYMCRVHDNMTGQVMAAAVAAALAPTGGAHSAPATPVQPVVLAVILFLVAATTALVAVPVARRRRG